jgi:hypothetical protein
MALQTRELFGGPTPQAVKPRLWAEKLMVLKLAAGTALLPVGTPLAKNSSTGFWVPFTQGGMNDTANIRAFLYESEAQLVAGGEILCVGLVSGEVYEADVNTAAIRAVLGGSPSEANVQTALVAGTPTLRELDIFVRGLPLTFA